MRGEPQVCWGRSFLAQGIRNARLIRTGYECNNQCVFCNQGDWRVSRGDKSSEDVKAEISAVDAGEVVVFSGGEVTLRDELVDWIRQAAARGPKRIIVQTNGRLLAHESYIEALTEAGADVFAIALHGPVAPLHDWLTQVPGSFMETLRGIQNARSVGATVLINCVITRSNFRHLGQLVELGDRLGVAALRFLWPDASGNAADNRPSVIPDPDVVLPYLKQAESIGARLGRRIFVELPHNLSNSDATVSQSETP